ncbi:hypothetical protein V2J09_018118 [Rumex salicifolius]
MGIILVWWIVLFAAKEFRAKITPTLHLGHCCHALNSNRLINTPTSRPALRERGPSQRDIVSLGNDIQCSARSTTLLIALLPPLMVCLVSFSTRLS